MLTVIASSLFGGILITTESVGASGHPGSRNPLSPTSGRLHREGVCMSVYFKFLHLVCMYVILVGWLQSCLVCVCVYVYALACMQSVYLSPSY